MLHGLIITKIGIPSFVVTLAGLLAWNGVVLLLIGSRGTVILQDDFTIGLANDFLAEGAAWILALGCIALYAGIQLNELRVRRAAGLETEPCEPRAADRRRRGSAADRRLPSANQDRGIPWVLCSWRCCSLFWSFVSTRTRFGRHIYAVGGNTEAARRAGINVDRPDRGLRDLLADGRARRHRARVAPALGGHQLGRRLDLLLYSIAAAVIGGTSLFGGRGHIKAAILGALVIGVDRQRPRPARPRLGREVRHHRRRAAARRVGRLDLAPAPGADRTSMTALLGRAAFITGASRGVGAAVARAWRRRARRSALASRSGDDLGLEGAVGVRVRRARPGAGAGGGRRDGRGVRPPGHRRRQRRRRLLRRLPRHPARGHRRDDRRQPEGHAVHGARDAAAPVEAGGGDFVALASVAGLRGFPGETGYNASKFGQVGFVRVARPRDARAGVRCTTLCPGGIATDFAMGTGPDAGHAELDGMMSADEVADVVLFTVTRPRTCGC